MKQITTTVGDIFVEVRSGSDPSKLWVHWGAENHGFVTVTTAGGASYNVKGTNRRTATESPIEGDPSVVNWLPTPAGVIVRGRKATREDAMEIRDAVIAGLNAWLPDTEPEVADRHADAARNQLGNLYDARAAALARLAQIEATIEVMENE